MIGPTRRERSQSLLLERYWTALRRNRNAVPPSALDPEIAELAAQIEEELQPRDASSAFINSLEQRLYADASSRLNQATWTRPSIDRRRQPRPPSDLHDTEHTEEIRMPNVTGTPGDYPVPLSQRLSREWLKIAAATIVFIALGAI